MEVLIYILDARIQKQRLKDMKEAAKRRTIKVAGEFSHAVSHVVTEFKDLVSVIRKLDFKEPGDLGLTEVVSVEWFTDCMKAGKVVAVLDKHRIKSTVSESATVERSQETLQLMPEYACQRATPLKHHNHKFTDALETLERYAELREGPNDYSRALAFRRASCVLKCLQFPLTTIQQLRNVTNIGDHSKKVLQDLLEDGISKEVEDIRNDPWFHKMKLFTGVFGIGPSTAKKWIERGWNSIREAQQGYTSADWRVQWGLGFHDDLNTPVSRSETEYILNIVRKHLHQVLPGAIMELTGGFRRGKTTGHDVDILITHPTEGRENGALSRLLRSLQSHDIILCGKQESSNYTDEVLTKDFKLSARGQLDHFEKWLGIVKVPKSVGQITYDTQNTDDENILYRRTSSVVNQVISNDNNENKVSVKQSPVPLIQANLETNPQCDYSKPNHVDNTENGWNDTDTSVNISGTCTNNGNLENTPDDVDNIDEDLEVSGESIGDFEVDARQQRQCLNSKSPLGRGKEARDWLARRVDLIIAPHHQYYYALVGWTGNKQFNRDLRTYAPRELNMKLTSHGLYDFNSGKKLPANSEQDVFDNLKLTYRLPSERNC